MGLSQTKGLLSHEAATRHASSVDRNVKCYYFNAYSFMCTSHYFVQCCYYAGLIIKLIFPFSFCSQLSLTLGEVDGGQNETRQETKKTLSNKKGTTILIETCKFKEVEL